MPCYKPLKGFPIGVTENGKPNYKVCSYDVERLDLTFDRSGNVKTITAVTSQMIKAGYSVTPGSTQQITYFVELPCGQCEGCRLTYSRRWADRCMLELQSHTDAWFVTLTYDNDHVPVIPVTDEYGEIQQCAGLDIPQHETEPYQGYTLFQLPQERVCRHQYIYLNRSHE